MTHDTEQKIKAILTTEVKYVVGIIVFVAGVVAPYFQIRSDIALIKSEQNNISKLFEKHIKQYEEEEKEKANDLTSLKSRTAVIEDRIGIKNIKAKTE